jgi:hypothetical protein
MDGAQDHKGTVIVEEFVDLPFNHPVKVGGDVGFLHAEKSPVAQVKECGSDDTKGNQNQRVIRQGDTYFGQEAPIGTEGIQMGNPGGIEPKDVLGREPESRL